jgi:hypothetical protein
MSLSDESLFREVDEEVRRQKVQELWNRWGNLFIAISLAVIVLVAGFKGWQYWELKRSEEAARDYFAAVQLADQGKSADAAKKFRRPSRLCISRPHEYGGGTCGIRQEGRGGENL